jgi:hypothetical protein
MIRVFQQAKMVHDFDHATTVIGNNKPFSDGKSTACVRDRNFASFFSSSLRQVRGCPVPPKAECLCVVRLFEL